MDSLQSVAAVFLIVFPSLPLPPFVLGFISIFAAIVADDPFLNAMNLASPRLLVE